LWFTDHSKVHKTTTVLVAQYHTGYNQLHKQTDISLIDKWQDVNPHRQTAVSHVNNWNRNWQTNHSSTPKPVYLSLTNGNLWQTTL